MRKLPGEDLKVAAFRRVVAGLRNRIDLPVAEAIEFLFDVVGREDDAGLQRCVVGVDARRKREPPNLELADGFLVDVDRHQRDPDEDHDDGDGEHLENCPPGRHQLATIARFRPLFLSRR